MKSWQGLLVTGVVMLFLLGCASGLEKPSEPDRLETEAEDKPQATRTVAEGRPQATVTIELGQPRATKTDVDDRPLATETASGDQPEPTQTEVGALAAVVADVVSVQVRGEAGAYQFSVEVRSPDTGCEQYADWWEVLTEDGQLLYRRILLHSHVGEQPFVRSGGPVPIEADTTVWIRAHMNSAGYEGQVFKGSAVDGFELADTEPGFASEVAQLEPLPTGCNF